MLRAIKTTYRILAGIVRVVKLRGVEPPDDAAEIIAMLVTQAQLEISSQIQTDVGRIATSVTFMGVDLTAITLLAAIQAIVGGRWWWPAVPLLLSAGAFFRSVWGEELEPGPPIRAFYETYGQASSLDAHTAMLSQLVAAVEENQRNSKRAFWSGIGYALSTLSVLVAGFAFAVYPEWFLPHHHRTQVKHAHSNKPHYTHIAPEPLLYARKFDGKS